MKLNILILSLIAIVPLSGCNYHSPAIDPKPTPIITSLSLERFIFVRNKKFGYIDRNGNVIIPAQFEDADNFSEGFAKVKIGEKYGFIDRKGNIVIPPQFVNASNFHNGLARVKIDLPNGNKFGYIDRYGKIAIQPRFVNADDFSEGLAAVDLDAEKSGYINTAGKVVIPFQFSQASRFKNGSANVIMEASDSTYRTIDRTGKLLGAPILPGSSSTARDKFSNGLALVEIGDRLGYKDKNGKIVIPARYSIPVDDKINKGNYLDYLAGKYVPRTHICIPIKDSCFNVDANFDRGLALVMIPSKCGFFDMDICHDYGYIDTEGKLVFKF